MSLTERILTESEKEKFNDFMATSPKGHILQTWEWGEIKAKTGWRPFRLVVEEDNKIVGAVSILARPLPMNLGHLFYAPRGPVLDIERQDVWEKLLEATAKLAKKEKAMALKIDPDVKEDNLAWKNAIEKSGFKKIDKGEGFEGVQPRNVFRLDISPDLDELLANCHQKTRYNIRLAGRRGVTISKPGKKGLKQFYEILEVTAERDEFLIRPYSYFEDMYDYLVGQGYGELFLANYEDKVLAGTLALKIGEKSWYLYGASSNEHRNVMPNYLLQWTMIEWAKENGCTMYDFRGVPGDVEKDHPLYGLVKFKKGFNGDYTSFIGEYDLVYRPFVYGLYDKAMPIYQNAVRKKIAKEKAKDE